MKDDIIGNKKIINAWTLYDWANSAHALVIASTVFPIYYDAITTDKVTKSNIVPFMGGHFNADSLYTFALSAAYLFVAFLSPMLSSMADYSGKKKQFMMFFCFVGSFSCLTMHWFTSIDTLWIGIFSFFFSMIGYSGSIVFYNAFLPEIAAPEQQDKVSARGFAMGYTGSSLLLIFNLTMIKHPEWYGITESSLPARISFVLVGVWWLGFSMITFYYLPGNIYNKKPSGNILTKGYMELLQVWKVLKKTNRLKKFLSAFFFYNMGTQTVMYVATLFGTNELHLDSGVLITTILLIQFVAIAGAFLFASLSKWFGNIKAIGIAILVWIFVCVGAYFVTGEYGFYAIGFTVGMVMGGIQSLSRSTYSKLLPETQDHASFFSFFDICDKMSIVLGTFSYGLILELTGNMRNSIIALILFFITGLILLFRINKVDDSLLGETHS
ncbi:MAG: MFS transporter [Bacteroidota bacterium]